jgi:hypothetical protein
MTRWPFFLDSRRGGSSRGGRGGRGGGRGGSNSSRGGGTASVNVDSSRPTGMEGAGADRGADSQRQAMAAQPSSTRGGRGGFARGGKGGPIFKENDGGGPTHHQANSSQAQTAPSADKGAKRADQPKPAAKIILGKGIESKISAGLLEELGFLPYFPADNGRGGTQAEVLRMMNESLDELLSMPLHKSVPCFAHAMPACKFVA